MKANEFRELMIGIMKMQIGYIRENENYGESDFLQGQEIGLETAIEKLQQAAFLTEKGEN